MGSGVGGGGPLGMIFFGSMVAVPFGLGTWQMQRREWKKKLMDSRLEALRSKPVSLMGAVTMGNTPCGDESRKVMVSGTFDHTKELLIGPRSPPSGISFPPLQTASKSDGGTEALNQMGYHVLTPLYSDDDNVHVVVNRGWVPYLAARTKEWERPSGHVKVMGILSKGEEKLFFMSDSSSSPGTLLRANLPDVIENMGLADQQQQHDVCHTHIIDTIDPDGLPAESFPLAKQEVSLLNFHVGPETHLMYAVTWYTLGAAAALITRFRFRKRFRKR